jgi:cell division protein FtsB
MASDGARVVRRLVVALLIVGGVAFAVEGGEFGTIDLYRQARRKNALSKSIDSLQRIVDSLRRYENAVEHDPATQERIAREVFGMVRGEKEILYRLTDSLASHPRP